VAVRAALPLAGEISTGEVKSNGELLVAAARVCGFLMARWLFVTPEGIERLVAVSFAERAATGMLLMRGYRYSSPNLSA
jgi:hypothetical protein